MKKVFFLLIIISKILISQGHYGSINRLIPNTKDNSIISIGKDEQIIIWNLESYEIKSSLALNRGHLRRGTLMNERNFLVTTPLDGLLYFTSLNTNTLVDIVNPRLGLIEDIYSLEQDQIIILGKNGVIELYDYRSNRTIKRIQLQGHISSSFLDSSHLYIATSNYKIKRIQTENFELEDIFYIPHKNEITSIKISNNTISSASWDGGIIIYDLGRDMTLFSTQLDYGKIATAIYTYGFYLFAGLNSGDIEVFNILTGNKISTLAGRARVKDIYVENDIIVAAYMDSRISFFKVEGFEHLATYTDY